MFGRKSTAGAALGIALAMLPGAAAAQTAAQIQMLTGMMQLATEGANVAGSAVATTSINSPFSPSAAGVSYEVDPDTCGLSPWSRANAEAISVNVGPAVGDIRFATGIVGVDYACTNIGGKGLDVSAGIYGGGTTGVVTSPTFPTVKFDVRQVLVGAYTQFSKGNFAGNLKIQHSEEDYIGTGFVAAGLPPGMVPEGSTLSLSRTAVSGAASYAWEAMDNTFLIPIVGFDVAHLRPDPIQFGGNFMFVPQTSTAVLVYGGLTLAHTIVLPNGTSAFVPFISGNYYADVGAGIAGNVTGTLPTLPFPTPVDVAITGNADMSYSELGAGFNYISILDDGTGGSGVKQLTFGLRGFYKWNAIMKGWGGAGSVRLQF